MIQLIALDIDGTLLDSKGAVPSANVEALARALDAGIEIVLATGRRYDFARPVFEQLPGPLTLILSNGAIVKNGDGETKLRQLLPRDVARSILSAVSEHRDTAALLFDRPREGQVVFERVQWDHPRYRAFFRANRQFISEVTPLEDALTDDPLQLMFTGGCSEMRALFEQLLQDGGAHGGQLPDVSGAADHSIAIVAEPVSRPGSRARARYAVAMTEYVHRDFSLVDVIQAGCSKGAALREWAAQRGIAPAQVMAIGDNLNDLQMLEFAGRPVVMANGIDDLKARGWSVTASNDDGGVARAIDEILPPRRGVQAQRD
ncbi:MAG: Cof-type HAD-IIB family hydrolase [Vicinamibacterales bacterium]